MKKTTTHQDKRNFIIAMIFVIIGLLIDAYL
jgi:hypothetical protein